MKMSKNEESFEISYYKNRESLPESAWKVRPCEWYKDEYKDCKSICMKGRFHQYFIHGEMIECSQWKTDFDNCMVFRKKQDNESLEKILRSEEERYAKRKNSVLANDVWEYRKEAPESWNSPIPDWFIEKKKASLLIDTQNALNEGTTPTPVFNGIGCCIM